MANLNEYDYDEAVALVEDMDDMIKRMKDLDGEWDYQISCIEDARDALKEGIEEVEAKEEAEYQREMAALNRQYQRDTRPERYVIGWC